MNFSELLNSDLKKEIADAGYSKLFAAGSVIVNIHSYIKTIPVVISGSIKVIKTDEAGNEILLYYITAGQSCIVSVLASMNNETSKIKAVVEEDAEILLLPTQKTKEWIRTYPEWTDFIFNLYQKRFDELLEVLNAVAFQKIDARLLHLLKQKKQLYQSTEINVTHQQLADELGITREATSRVLKQMEHNGMLQLSRNRIMLM
ncbi:MAG: Crp/Fnr family transcriptional regulator [Kaistella sp.]